MSNKNLIPGGARPQRKTVNANKRSNQEDIEFNNQIMQDFRSLLSLERSQTERLGKDLEETKQSVSLILEEAPNLSLFSNTNENQRLNDSEPPPNVPPEGSEVPITYSISIFFKTGHAFSLQVNAASTVGQIKEEIAKLELIPVDRQRLKFSGRYLLNNDTMAGIKVKDHSLLEFDLINNRQASETERKSRNSQSGSCLIYIKMMEERTIKLDFDIAESVKSLKIKIMDTLGAVPREQRLIFEGRDLAEMDKSLGDYGVRNKSTINLIRYLRGC